MQLRTEKNISFLSHTLISCFKSGYILRLLPYYSIFQKEHLSMRLSSSLAPTALVHPHHQGHGSHHHGCSTSCRSDWICFKFLRRNMRSPWNTVLQWSVVYRCQGDSSWEGNTEVINMYKVYAMCIDVARILNFWSTLLCHFNSFPSWLPGNQKQPWPSLAKWHARCASVPGMGEEPEHRTEAVDASWFEDIEHHETHISGNDITMLRLQFENPFVQV